MYRKFIFGIDLGATNIKIGLVDSHGRIVTRKYLFTKSFSNREKLLSKIIEVIYNVLKQSKIQKKNILGIGIGLPGLINFKTGMIHYLPNIPGWKNFPIKRWFSSKVKLPTFVDNDVNLITLAEHRIGAGRETKNMICLTLGTGVGGGIIINGDLYRGSSFVSGEIGHIPLTENGPRCNCGGRGCLECFVGNRYILRLAKRRMMDKKITLEKIDRLAREGNSKAIAIWREVGRYIGIALVGVVNLLNPEKIVIGGGITGAGEVLFSQIRKMITLRAMPIQAKTVKIVKARFGADAGILGAAILVKEGKKV
jgi:glucokinase